MSLPTTKKTLRCIAGVEMWREIVRVPGHRSDVLRYFVRTTAGVESFDRAHNAWERFREITGVSNTLANPPEPLPVTFRHWNDRVAVGK